MATMEAARYSQFLVSPRMPPELVLKTIQYLPFGDGKAIASLCCAHPRLWRLFKSYERSITASFMRRELRHAQTDFPCEKEAPSLRWLVACVRKYDIVDDIMDALFSERNCFAVARHNLSLVNAGVLLCYRLASLDDHAAKLAHIAHHLPRDALTAIYLALHHATLSARYHGSGWIHQRTYGRFMDANQLSLRNELEFCFAEAALYHGPEFLANMLLHHDTSDAETTLLNVYHDHGTLDWDWPCWGSGAGEFEPPKTQGPQRDVGQRCPSLFSTLLERLAHEMGSSLAEVRSRIETDTDDPNHPLAYLGLEGKAQLMQGRNVNDGHGGYKARG